MVIKLGNSLWHPGAPAPGLPFDFSNFENASEKSEKKIEHKHTQVLNTREKFQQKITIFLLCTKKTNF